MLTLPDNHRYHPASAKTSRPGRFLSSAGPRWTCNNLRLCSLSRKTPCPLLILCYGSRMLYMTYLFGSRQNFHICLQSFAVTCASSQALLIICGCSATSDVTPRELSLRSSFIVQYSFNAVVASINLAGPSNPLDVKRWIARDLLFLWKALN